MARKTQVFVLVENAMVDGAATSALQAPFLASSSGQRPVHDANVGPVVPATPARERPRVPLLLHLSTSQRCVKVGFDDLLFILRLDMN